MKSRSGPRFACLCTAGPHEITAAWIKKSDAIDPVRATRPIRSSHDTRDPLGIPHLLTFTIAGPFKPKARATCRVAARSSRASLLPGADERCARQIIATLVRRAYRGQGTDADVERLMSFCRAGRQQRDFDRGIQVALQRVLASPKFVFRAEREPDNFPQARLSSQRSRAGVASLVLPLEQHPRRRIARGGDSRAGCRIRPCSNARSAACSPIRSRSASWPTLPASGSICGT